MKLHSLEDLFVDHLRDLYSAENQILRALPKMIKKAASQGLKNAFEEHLQQTRGHAERLQQIFDQLDLSPRNKKCKGMEGLIEEGEEAISDAAQPSVCDAALIAAAQRVEHYEIAGYGCARTYAYMVGMDDAASLLQQTLTEEKETDERLTRLAEEAINVQAVGAGNPRA
jgi:ferritin-like metal-binding protein YciE